MFHFMKHSLINCGTTDNVPNCESEQTNPNKKGEILTTRLTNNCSTIDGCQIHPRDPYAPPDTTLIGKYIPKYPSLINTLNKFSIVSANMTFIENIPLCVKALGRVTHGRMHTYASNYYVHLRVKHQKYMCKSQSEK